MTTLFLVFRNPGPSWAPAVPSREQALWTEHALFMDRLFENGKVVLAGPYADYSRVLIIVQAHDATDAANLFNEDPWTQAGILVLSEIIEWNVFLDSRQTPFVQTTEQKDELMGNHRAKPHFHTIAPQFTVSDVVATSRYYSDILGFETRGFFGEPPVFAIVARGQIEIFFNQDPTAKEKSRVRAAGAYDAYIHMGDIDSFGIELAGRGANIVEGPVDRVYGMREIVIEDCNGLRLAFGAEATQRAG